MRAARFSTFEGADTTYRRRANDTVGRVVPCPSLNINISSPSLHADTTYQRRAGDVPRSATAYPLLLPVLMSSPRADTTYRHLASDVPRHHHAPTQRIDAGRVTSVFRHLPTFAMCRDDVSTPVERSPEVRDSL